MILIVAAVKKESISPLKNYLEQEKFPEEKIHFINSFQESPFSLNSFLKEFSDTYYRFKPERVIFLMEEEFGGEEHLIYSMLYFKKQFSRKIPFEPFIVEDMGEGKPLSIQEIQPELQQI